MASAVFSGCDTFKARKVRIGNTCVTAQVADTPTARQKGLMFIKSMPENRGMLFVFEKDGYYGFWMKNTLFPLDIIWIDSRKKIVAIYQNALPCKDVCRTVAPEEQCRYALEVNAGFSVKYHLQPGDTVLF